MARKRQRRLLIMKIKETTVRKLLITGIDNLDPVNVFVEEYTPTSGKITMECFGKAWSYFWGSIGDRSIMEFFCSCDNHYLSRKFDPQLESKIDDPDMLPEHAKNYIINMRKERDIDRKQARDLYDKAEYVEMNDHNLLFEIYGDEWWCALPKQPNQKYEYLGRILDVAKAGVKTLIPVNTTARSANNE